ncbi:hypothetical protein NPIL_7431 [Nephila pilipes]|uniref:Uncharacterized protein n=1 Tax=Nephila pilipes TaxID=299642 RepID=A0A8X6P9E8_NEPPI|nr:hypothetical protein NPIL_7431 [Nephila pilipes]
MLSNILTGGPTRLSTPKETANKCNNDSTEPTSSSGNRPADEESIIIDTDQDDEYHQDKLNQEICLKFTRVEMNFEIPEGRISILKSSSPWH